MAYALLQLFIATIGEQEQLSHYYLGPWLLRCSQSKILLVDILVLQSSLVDQISTIVHGSRVSKKGHGLGKAKDQASNVRFPFGLLMRFFQFLDVAADKGFLTAKASHCANIRDGLNCQLQTYKEKVRKTLHFSQNWNFVQKFSSL